MFLLPFFGAACGDRDPGKKNFLKNFISEIELIDPVVSGESFNNEAVELAGELVEIAKKFKNEKELTLFLKNKIDLDIAENSMSKLNGVIMPRTDLALQYLKFRSSQIN
jgi:hypothetical protein